MTTKTVIAATTAAVTANVQYSADRSSVPMSIIAKGLAGAETVTVSFSVDKGATFEAASQNDTAVVLTATNNIVSWVSPCLIGFTKSATAGAASVSVSY